jgi:hypothetical protein
MKAYLILFLIFSVLNINFADAQDDMKRWKKKFKDMSVEEFARTVTDFEALKTEVEGLKKAVPVSTKTKVAKEEELAELQKNAQSATTTNKEKKKAEKPSNVKIEDFTKGVCFRVQVASVPPESKKKLEMEISQSRFVVETDESGNQKYIIGSFRDYWDADLFRHYLCEMGIKDAWLICYKDNQRVAVSDIFSEEEINAIKAKKEEPEYKNIACSKNL